MRWRWVTSSSTRSSSSSTRSTSRKQGGLLQVLQVQVRHHENPPRGATVKPNYSIQTINANGKCNQSDYLPVCWSAGLLICWSASLLVCWSSVGLLVCWSVEMAMGHFKFDKEFFKLQEKGHHERVIRGSLLLRQGSSRKPPPRSYRESELLHSDNQCKWQMQSIRLLAGLLVCWSADLLVC